MGILALLKGDKTRNEVCSEFGIHPTQADKWKQKVLAGLPSLFGIGNMDAIKERDKLIDQLYQQVGKLTSQLDWLKKRWDIPISEKIKLVEHDNTEFSIRERCELLQLNRSTLYYCPKPELSQEDIMLMHKIDQIYTKRPMYGYPRMTAQLKKEGMPVNHKRVYRLMSIMGIEALFPKKNLSKADKTHEVYPYLLKDIIASYPNHVWGVDITYVKL